MTRIWNPYVFTPLGNPIVGEAPPVLRVMGGMQATAQQLSYAQQRFTQFVMQARLSVVPNPTEAGRLPDGTQYRIVVVGPQTVMEIWPGGGANAAPRGVGLSTGVGAGTVLFVVTFKGGKWLSTRPKKFYGGPGLWVSADGKDYLTDNLPRAEPVGAFSGRRYPDTGVYIPDAATTIFGGVGYADTNGGVGLITPARKYAQVAVSGGAGTMNIVVSDAPVATESEILLTPDDPAATPVPRGSVQVSAPGAELLPINDGAAPFRLRSGGEVGFPTTGGGAHFPLVPPMLSFRGPLSPRHISGLVQVAFPGTGGYSAGFSASGIEGEDPITENRLKKKVTRAQRYWVDFDPRRYPTPSRPVMVGTSSTHRWYSPGSGDGFSQSGGYSPAIPSCLYVYKKIRATDEYTDEIKTNARGGVLVSRDWADAPVEFTASSDFTYSAKVEKVIEQTYEAAETPLFTPSADIRESTGDGVYTTTSYEYTTTLISSPPGNPADPPLEGMPSSRNETKATTKYQEKTTLEMPWGSVDLMDVDLTGVHHKVIDIVAKEVTIDLSELNGHFTQRFVVHADPVLSAIAYVEMHAQEFLELEDDGAQIVAASMKFVVAVEGVDVFTDERAVDGLRLTATFHKNSTSLGYLEWGPRISSSRDVACTAPAQVREASYRRVTGTDGSGYEVSTTKLSIEDINGTLTANSWTSDNQKQVAVQDVPRPFITDPASVSLPEYRALSAVDPNSGGGVVLAVIDGQVRGAWTVAPGGQTAELKALLGVRPQDLNPMVISV